MLARQEARACSLRGREFCSQKRSWIQQGGGAPATRRRRPSGATARWAHARRPRSAPRAASARGGPARRTAGTAAPSACASRAMAALPPLRQPLHVKVPILAPHAAPLHGGYVCALCCCRARDCRCGEGCGRGCGDGGAAPVGHEGRQVQRGLEVHALADLGAGAHGELEALQLQHQHRRRVLRPRPSALAGCSCISRGGPAPTLPPAASPATRRLSGQVPEDPPGCTSHASAGRTPEAAGGSSRRTSMVMRLVARTMRLCLGHLYLLSPSSTSAVVKRCTRARSADRPAAM